MGRRIVASMTTAVDAVVRRLRTRCYAGIDAASLQTEFLDCLAEVVPFDAAFCAPVDPATLLFTGGVLRGIPPESAQRFLANEFFDPDVNKFRSLAFARSPVEFLDRATRGDRSVSTRYREIMAPLGLGDELRASFRAGGECWGFLCLHREDGPLGFSVNDARLVGRLSALLGEGIRRSLLVEAAADAEAPDEPGMLVVDGDGTLVATTAAAERWLWELDDPGAGGMPMSVAVQSLRARLLSMLAGDESDGTPSVRMRSRSGRWVMLHAAEIAGIGAGRHVAIMIEPVRQAELAPIILAAHGLTKREGEVARLALQGKSNKQVARALRITEHTVEDHLKSIFTKVGVGTRGELTARVYSRHYR
jgi:DNA-binding CsgD family transcriptional regulator